MTPEIVSQTPQSEARFDLDEALKSTEITEFGRMTLASVACGLRVTNDDLLYEFKVRTNTDPEQVKKAEELLEATGFTVRRASWEVTPTHDEIFQRTSQIGVHLIKSLMEEKGWDSVDAVLDTSASLPEDIGKKVIEKAGLDPETTLTKPYRLACGGAIAAVVDTLADAQMKDKRVIVLALEPLSQHVKPSQCSSIDTIPLPAIFGDDYAAIAFNTSDFEVVAPRTHIVYDGAPIKFYADYSLPPTDEGSIPSHYTFGERGREISSITKNGVLLNIEEPENKMPSSMDGWRTFKFFVPETIAVIKYVVERAQAQGIEVEQAVMHQPSKKVNEGFQRQSKKIDALTGLEIPSFLLGQIERSNSSSGTSLVIWQHLAKEGQIDPNKPLLVCAPGIGSAISAGVIVPAR